MQDGATRHRARALTELLVSWPSVTGTADEASFPSKLAEFLGATPYFQNHPDDIVIAPIPGDPLGRSNLLALVKGGGRRTVLLTGHFDVVPEDNYGDLAGLARAPDALRAGLVERLERTGAHPQALADLRSGRFVPGRGALDMKSGLAAGLCALEAFAAEPLIGNILFVTTPDEEDRSVGMRAAADMLPAFLQERGLDPVLAINLDAICDEGTGETGRIVAMGCLGKLLLSAMVVGKEAHAAYPFAGVNAAYLAAELITEIECAPALAELSGPELAAPPTVLGAKDGKTLYNVTTPGDTWLFWNVLVHRRRAAEVLAIARQSAEVAITRGSTRMQERAGAIGQTLTAADAWSRATVLSFVELFDRARQTDPAFEGMFRTEAERLANDAALDLPERSRRLTRLAWEVSGLEGPAVVLGFASMTYPAIPWAGEAGVEQAIREAVETTSADLDSSIRMQNYYPAIADMSFLGPVDQDDLRQAAANTPVWGSSIPWNLDRPPTPGIPVINIGPWGRDYHHALERADADYAFRVLPQLLSNVVRNVLAASVEP